MNNQPEVRTKGVTLLIQKTVIYIQTPRDTLPSEFGRITKFFHYGHRMRDVSILHNHVPLQVLKHSTTT